MRTIIPVILLGLLPSLRLRADPASDKAKICARLAEASKKLAGECREEIRHRCDEKHPTSETRVPGDCPSCDEMDEVDAARDRKGCP